MYCVDHFNSTVCVYVCVCVCLPSSNVQGKSYARTQGRRMCVCVCVLPNVLWDSQHTHTHTHTTSSLPPSPPAPQNTLNHYHLCVVLQDLLWCVTLCACVGVQVTRHTHTRKHIRGGPVTPSQNQSAQGTVHEVNSMCSEVLGGRERGRETWAGVCVCWCWWSHSTLENTYLILLPCVLSFSSSSLFSSSLLYSSLLFSSRLYSSLLFSSLFLSSCIFSLPFSSGFRLRCH